MVQARQIRPIALGLALLQIPNTLRHCVANTNTVTNTKADQARSSWRDVNETRRHCVAESEAKAGRQAHAEGEAQGQAEAEADAHTEAEADAHAQGRKPLHTHAASGAPAPGPAVPACVTHHDRARRAGRAAGQNYLPR